MFRNTFGLDGAIVDPDSCLQDTAHVYIANEKLYSVALDNVDLSPHVDKNSYYKLQLLESDADNPKRLSYYKLAIEFLCLHSIIFLLFFKTDIGFIVLGDA